MLLATAAVAGSTALTRLLAPSSDAEPPRPDQAFGLHVAAVDAATLAVRFTVADCCYLYRDKIRFKLSAPDGSVLTNGPRLGKVNLPRGETVTDPFFGRLEIYRRDVDVRLPLAPTPAREVALEVSYQGCAEVPVAICYEPATRRFLLRPNGAGLVVTESG